MNKLDTAIQLIEDFILPTLKSRRYKSIIEITDKEVEELLTAMYGDMVKSIDNIDVSIEDESVTVSFVTQDWDDGDETSTSEFNDTITLYSDSFLSPSFSSMPDDRLKYEQFVIAKGYSSCWKDNPFVV